MVCKKCHQQCRASQKHVSSQRNFNKVFDRLTKAIGEIEMKLEIVPLRQCLLETLNARHAQLQLMENLLVLGGVL